ncbi:putative cytochrome 78A3-like [Capsicum annuum]|nr:putative cytochrome 78A3-like [Capsicum annuum]
MQSPNISIKAVREVIKSKHHFTPSYRKAQRGQKKAFVVVYGDFESSFKALPRYMTAQQYFNPGTIVEWDHYCSTMQGEKIFKFLFWTFKLSIDGFKYCRPVISIDGTHLYGLYDLKLLITIGIDGNILPLVYALVARESFESWS